MAFNPQSYETIYGFSFLDEIHNFFPELLYDDTLFGAESMRWIRHRVNVLFPQAFVRQRNLYNIYSARARLRSYVQWQLDAAQRPTTPIQAQDQFVMLGMPPLPRAPAPPAPPAPPAAPRTVDISGAAAHPRTRTQIPTLLTSLLWEIREPGAQDVPGDTILDMLNFAFQDVVVAPTLEQINAASTIRNANSVPADTICSICQEHTLHTSDDQSWRALNCGHVFHRDCIDTWFSSHIQCPICRTDVRRIQAPPRPENT